MGSNSLKDTRTCLLFVFGGLPKGRNKITREYSPIVNGVLPRSHKKWAAAWEDKPEQSCPLEGNPLPV